ncbi:ATP-binding cassette, subfamily B, MsbA [Octadecabacter temperatus]|uniref:Lipid A export ATP-binding/permease protein MsbA n=2 Tax=Octadecabacter temperatus TaxID=1458307 RepID=A0A0K0Y352_9RHOB|nr:ABC transporter ATP-binding protein [Octadecabacter temperatus]AKS45390.1 Lipid A export ATP-binding/permease protein MsbA [Octadecabacter temperatus]SIN91893.1 ATP-binding cassette, subfamily B, MsbA [Octadecabacter temperatus]
MLLWLWVNYLSHFKGWLAVAVLLMAIEGATFGSISFMMQPMFDRVFVGGETGSIWTVGLIILAIFVVRAFAALIQNVIMTYVSQRSGENLRSDLMGHIIGLDTAYHQTHPPGQMIERVQGDVASLSTVWVQLVAGLARDMVAVISLLSVAFWIDWKWMLIALIGIPIVILPAVTLRVFVRRKALAARAVSAEISTRMDEVFHGITQVKLNSLENYQTRRFDKLLKRRVGTEVEARFGQELLSGTVDIMAGVGFLAVIVFGGSEIIEGEKTVGQFMAFFTAMAIAFDPIRRLAKIFGKWQVATAAIERILDVFDTKATLLSPPTPATAPTAAPEITFTDVSLSYGDLPVLNGTSFTAQAGQTTALVGASGAGKSTLFNVLTRLIEPQDGSVTLNGTPINALALTDLRALISTVSQDAALFDETLLENILLGREGVSNEALQAALKDAHVADFLENLPDGLDSAAGPRGSNLSGGQRQRIAIARALFRDTPILLLDEATSALDTKSETIVQSALDRLAEGRTTLVIAHRLSTIQNANKIVVMDKGQVVDQGTHEDLLARGGLYADLYRLQFRDGKQVVDHENRPKRTPIAAKSQDRPQSWLSRLFKRRQRP